MGKKQKHIQARTILSAKNYQKLLASSLLRSTLLVCLSALSLIQIWNAWHGLYSNGMDLQQDYIAAQRIRHGLDIYEPFTNEELVGLIGKEPNVLLTFNAHPPLVSMLFIPLTLFPFKWAALIWTVGCVIILWLTFNIILAEFKLKIKGFWRYLLQLSILNWYPVLAHLNLGQLGIPLFFLSVTAWICLRRDQETLAGFLLAFATLIKLYPVVLLLYSVIRCRLDVLKAAVFSAFFLVIMQTAINPHYWPNYLLKIVPMTSLQYQDSWYNCSLSSISIRLLNGTEISPPLLDLPQAELPVRFILYAIIFVSLAVVFWCRRSDPDLTGEFCLLIVAMLLLSPLTWDHAFVFLLMPMSYLWQQVRVYTGDWSRWPVVLIGLGVALSIPHWRQLMGHVQTLYIINKLPFLIGLFSPSAITLLCCFISIWLTLWSLRS